MENKMITLKIALDLIKIQIANVELCILDLIQIKKS